MLYDLLTFLTVRGTFNHRQLRSHEFHSQLCHYFEFLAMAIISNLVTLSPWHGRTDSYIAKPASLIQAPPQKEPLFHHQRLLQFLFALDKDVRFGGHFFSLNSRLRSKKEQSISHPPAIVSLYAAR